MSDDVPLGLKKYKRHNSFRRIVNDTLSLGLYLSNKRKSSQSRIAISNSFPIQNAFYLQYRISSNSYIQGCGTWYLQYICQWQSQRANKYFWKRTHHRQDSRLICFYIVAPTLGQSTLWNRKGGFWEVAHWVSLLYKVRFYPLLNFVALLNLTRKLAAPLVNWTLYTTVPLPFLSPNMMSSGCLWIGAIGRLSAMTCLITGICA